MTELLALRRDVREARAEFRRLDQVRVSDDAPLPVQHQYWDARDGAHRRYAELDWRWQKVWLRVGLAALAVTTAIAAIAPSLCALAFSAVLFVAWRICVVLRRLSPEKED